MQWLMNRWSIFLFALILVGCYQPITPPLNQSIAYSVAWAWDSQTIYRLGDEVTMPEYTQVGPVYRSLQNGNAGICPPSEIVTPDNVYGSPGSQYPWIIATPGWQNWWTKIR